MTDPDFMVDPAGLARAVELLGNRPGPGDLPADLPETGLGSHAALEVLAPAVLGGARRLDAPTSLDHMDPPTPWVAWATTLWNAALNQNLLHPDISPVAGAAERRVVAWLAPLFGMDGGHMTPGSTVSNLTALWAARDIAGVRRVLAGQSAHISMPKAAHLLGLEFMALPTGPDGALDPSALPDDMTDVALVLTAGTTSTGAIDPMHLAGRAAWTHVDAAWAGPLRLTRHAALLDGVDRADSVAISGHKWLFQPKESALVLFRDTARAHDALGFGGAYLATPNIGVLGSHGAAAIPLMATLLALGRDGLAARIEGAMDTVHVLYDRLTHDARAEVHGKPVTGVLLWRPATRDLQETMDTLPKGMVSRTAVDGKGWLRNVAANPMADINAIWPAIDRALGEGPPA